MSSASSLLSATYCLLSVVSFSFIFVSPAHAENATDCASAKVGALEQTSMCMTADKCKAFQQTANDPGTLAAYKSKGGNYANATVNAGQTSSSKCQSSEVCCYAAVFGGTSSGSGKASASGQAAPVQGGLSNLPCEATGDCQIKDLVSKAVMFAQFLMGLAGALFLFAFVYGGAMYILAFGRSAYIDKGKKAMVQASIGMVLIMGAWTMVTYLVTSLGAKI